MRFVFRADASPSKGVGHVMRLLPLAQELIKRGHFVCFIGEIHEVSWLKSRVDAVGFSEFFTNSTEYKPSSGKDILILDSYEIEVGDDFVQKKNWKFVVVLADELTPHYDANLIFHPGIGGSWIETWSQPILHGLQFALIRDSLTSLKMATNKFDYPSIIILPGGTDAFRISELLVLSMAKFDFEFCCYVPINGRIVTKDSRFVSFELGKNMEELLGLCTGAITTASTTSLEMIALRIPLAIVSLTNNQNDSYDSLIREKLAVPLGKFDVSSVFPLKFDNLQTFVETNLVKFAEAQSNKSVIDGAGAVRIIEEILSIKYDLISPNN